MFENFAFIYGMAYHFLNLKVFYYILTNETKLKKFKHFGIRKKLKIIILTYYMMASPWSSLI
jgi:hypothetical protein